MPRFGSHAMKTYAGDRTIDGIVVTVDGRAPRPARSTSAGTARTASSGPTKGPSRASSRSRSSPTTSTDADHALALLVEPFMREVVAYLDNTWEMTSDDVAAAHRSICESN